MLTDRYQDALLLAADLHREQTRRHTSVPYLAHLLGVSALALEATAYYRSDNPEDIAIGALLHDAIEDQGEKISLRQIRQRFGARVYDIVHGCSDYLPDNSVRQAPGWHQRKTRFIAAIGHRHHDVQLVCCADKLYNARAIVTDHDTIGDKIWDRFSADKHQTLWYYKSLQRVFSEHWPGNPLLAEFGKTVSRMTRAVNGPRSGHRHAN